jgi:ammonium transporter, Amt family
MLGHLRRIAIAFMALTLALPPTLALAQSHAETYVTHLELDRLWVIICAALVFLMQAGFNSFETGMVQPKSATGIAMKNLADWIVASLCFSLVGFGLMFGASKSGLLGLSHFGMSGFGSPGSSELGEAFFLFQLAFAGTAVTIVSGAMSERTGFIPYLVGAGVIALVIYPVFGHWVWGNTFIKGNGAFLADLGFVDFAGSTAVHSVGAWVSLVGIWRVGPRLGRYRSDGTVVPFQSASFSGAAFGTMLLWFGWWGFNGGSSLIFDGKVGSILFNTNLAGAASGLCAYCHGRWVQGHRDLNSKFLGGVLGGLVAITACCHVVDHFSALMIGIGAGIIHNYAYEFLSRVLKLDDPVGAIAVHGACGVWGTLCVGIFGASSKLPHDRLTQIGVQCVGIIVCFLWTTSVAFLMYKALEKTIGLRVSPTSERNGVGITERHDLIAPPPEEQISEDELLALMGGK